MPINTLQEPVDLRVRRTHKLLWEALLTLMAEQEFETISVKEICDHAMVHRTTFYHHYEDKYDLLTHGMQHTHEMLLAEFERTGKDSSSYARFFEHVATNARFYRVMLCGNGIGSFQAQLRNYFADTIATELQHRERSGHIFPAPLPLLAQCYAGALVSALTWWLSNDLPASAEQMGSYMRGLLGETSSSREKAR